MKKRIAILEDTIAERSNVHFSSSSSRSVGSTASSTSGGGKRGPGIARQSVPSPRMSHGTNNPYSRGAPANFIRHVPADVDSFVTPIQPDPRSHTYNPQQRTSSSSSSGYVFSRGNRPVSYSGGGSMSKRQRYPAPPASASFSSYSNHGRRYDQYPQR